MTPDEFRHAGHRLIDWIAEYVETIEQRPVTSDVAPGDVLAKLPEHPPDAAEAFDDVLADVDSVIAPALTQWQHPSFFAFFPCNNSYASVLGDLLSTGLGVNGMNWATSPAATEVEIRVVDWMAGLLGLPDRFSSTSSTGGGAIQGTASEATLVAILSARWRATGGAVNTDGDTSRLTAYVTSQSHSSVEKGLRIAGFGTDRIRVVDVDEVYAMRTDALAAAIAADQAAGLVPTFVCATRGTTSSMGFDPTAALAPIVADAGAWLHVDAAMAGIAALALEHRWVNDGLEHADSYCTNPHKWMGIAFDCDLYWTADRAAMLGALSILPEYLRSAASHPAAVDFRDWQIPLGRRFRALKLWFGLRLDGVDAYVEQIRRHVAITARLVDWVGKDDRFDLAAPPQLNLACLRVADHAGGDAATDALIDAANATREVLFTRTVLNGRPVLRFSIGGRTTTERHVHHAWELLQRLVADPPRQHASPEG